MPVVLAARGHPSGRGRPRGLLLHAVPLTDRTRSALCGARVGGAVRSWHPRPGQAPAVCPECTALLG